MWIKIEAGEDKTLKVALKKMSDIPNIIEQSDEWEDVTESYLGATKDAEALLSIGKAYSDKGEYKKAIQAYKQAIRISPDYAEAHYYLGKAYSKLGDYSEAIEAFKQVIRIGSNYAALAHYNIGVAYRKTEEYQKAIEAFKQAIRIKPEHDDAQFDLGEAHFNLGISYLNLKNKGSALEQYKILKTLDKEKANELFNHIYK
ncbi:tetratricopeptide repeat protein [Thermodesulfobacteriota bacterium]